jgi:integrase
MEELTMVDYHRFEKQYQSGLTHLWKSDLGEADKQAIEQFLKSCRSEGTGYARLRKLCQVLVQIGRELGKPFTKVREKDLREILRKYEEGEYSFWTKHDVKVVLKQFYKWQHKGKYPHCVAWINTTIPHRQKFQLRNGDLLTEEEINKVIEATDHPRNKALLAVLSESGARIGEIGNLTIAQISVDPSGAILNVIGKTGPRRIRIISSTPFLVNWLNHHPDRKNPYAPVWLNVGSRGYHKVMAYESIRKIIQKAFKNAGIKKRCHPYIFRHSRITQLAHHLTEAQMNAYFGWVHGSEMPATYVHISGKDLDEQILKVHGIKPGEPYVALKPQNRTCPRCKEINSPSAVYCAKCAEIVDPTLALKTKIEESQKETTVKVKSPFLEWLQTDPELQHVLKRKLSEFRTNINEKPKLL